MLYSNYYEGELSHAHNNILYRCGERVSYRACYNEISRLLREKSFIKFCSAKVVHFLANKEVHLLLLQKKRQEKGSVGGKSLVTKWAGARARDKEGQRKSQRERFRRIINRELIMSLFFFGQKKYSFWVFSGITRLINFRVFSLFSFEVFMPIQNVTNSI